MPARRLNPKKPIRPAGLGALVAKPKPLPGPAAGARKTDIHRPSVRGELAKFLRSIDALPQLSFQQMPKPNVVFDYFRSGSDEQDGQPTQSMIPGHLIAAFAAGQEANEADRRYQWTHVLLCRKETVRDPLRKIKDAYPDIPSEGDFPPSGKGPRLYIAPARDEHGNPPWQQEPYTIWWIILVERQHRGTGREFRRIYLRRDAGRER